MTTKSILLKCTSWYVFVSELEKLTKKEKGDAFELLTKLYFKLSPKYEFYDEVWFLSETPSKVLEEIGLPQHDLGIDLIAKSGDDYHAIQCKYHSDRNQSVTFKEVSTFISLLESNTKLTQGYICSTADLTSRNFQKLKTKPINLILSDSWEELDKEFFKNINAFLTDKKVELVPFKPREHQVKALNEAIKYFDEEGNSRGKLIFPCGAGKSLTGFWMTQELKSKSTLIAVPSLSLVKQTLEVYLREIVANHKKVKWLCICSDEGIGQNEDIVFYTENLGIPCQTDPVYIEKWLKENVNQEIIIFTTYQSGRLIAEVSKKLNFTFDIGIFDEAHKTVGSDKKMFSHLLFEENISIHKRIFMTATERFYKGSKDDIISMDDETIYGDTFTKMSFKEAIEEGLLSDYKVITIDVQKSEIANFIKENNLVQLNDKWKKETEARSLASMLALRKAMKQFPIKNAVSFHSSIEKATRNKELQAYITESFDYEPIDVFTVSGKQPTTKRNAIVNEFANSSKALITNAKCLTEGVDVPNIDCIVFADPRKSKVDIVQALGRALRKKEGKEWGYVILPVVYDDETHEIDNENFEEILAIVRGLASNDERIVEYFKDKKDVNSVNKKDRIEQFQFEVFSDHVDANELSDQLQIKLWEKLSKFNWLPFEEARGYVHSLGLNDSTQWKSFCSSDKFPIDIPRKPDQTYKNRGWKGMYDWLGRKEGARFNKDKELLNYHEAKKIIHDLHINSIKDWREFKKSEKLPVSIPKNPNIYYKDKGWINWGDWFGTDRIATSQISFLSFKESKKEVKKLNINSIKEWQDLCQSNLKPSNLPVNPYKVYKNEWKGWGDWLSTGRVANQFKKFMPFIESKNFAKSLGLKNEKEWRIYKKEFSLPENIPLKPEVVYKDKGWNGFVDWFGLTKVTNINKTFRPFKEAREYIHGLKLKNNAEWRDFRKSENRPFDIPSNPNIYYKSEWVNLMDWLGTKNLKNSDKVFLPFKEARKHVRKLNLKSQKDWVAYAKSKEKPSNIPSNPNHNYKNSGWTSMGDWLGINSISNRNKEFLPYNEAKKIVYSIGLKTVKEWLAFCKTDKKPYVIPSNPNVYYKSEWKGWADFLGKEK